MSKRKTTHAASPKHGEALLPDAFQGVLPFLDKKGRVQTDPRVDAVRLAAFHLLESRGVPDIHTVAPHLCASTSDLKIMLSMWEIFTPQFVDGRLIIGESGPIVLHGVLQVVEQSHLAFELEWTDYFEDVYLRHFLRRGEWEQQILKAADSLLKRKKGGNTNA